MNITPELKKRILTGVLGGAFLLTMILAAGRIGVFLFVSVISLGMVYEFTEMVFTLPDRIEKRYVLLSITWLTALINILTSPLDFSVLTLAFLGLFIYFLLTAKRFDESDFLHHFRELVFSFFGLVYLVFMPQYLLRKHKKSAP